MVAMTMNQPSPQLLGSRGTSPPSPTTTFGSGSGTTTVFESPNSPRPPDTPCRPCRRHCKDCDLTKTRYDEQKDPEEDLEHPVHGWPEVAKLIAKYPDFEAFPTFKDLQLKSLLYYQGELDYLRKELHKLEWQDHRDGTFVGAEQLSERVDTLVVCGEIGREEKDSTAGQQMELVERIRTVLKNYNEALLQYSQVMSLPEADNFNVNSLRTWLEDSSWGNRQIQGPGSNSWGTLGFHERENPPSLIGQFLHVVRTIFWPGKPTKNNLDLVVPRAGRQPDRLAKWVANDFVPFWENVKKPRPKSAKTDEEMANTKKGKTQPAQPKQCRTQPSLVSYIKQKRGQRKKKAPKEGHGKISKGQPTLNEYSESNILLFTSFVSTVIACLLPIVAIAVLSKLHRQPELIGLIALFTFLFAIGLMFLTGGTSRVEIFTATAAFSAVLVVFVQNQNQSGSTSLSVNGTQS
jgi:hypothetical protein